MQERGQGFAASLEFRLTNLTCELFRSYSQSRLVYVVMKSLEFVQIMYFFMRFQDEYHWNFSFIRYISIFLNLTAVDRLLYKTSPALFVPLLAIALLLALVATVSAVYLAFEVEWGKKDTWVVRLAGQVVNFYLSLLRTALFIPFLTLIIVSSSPSIYANLNFTTSHSPAYLICGILLGLLFSVHIFYLILIFRESSPFGGLPQAGQTIFRGVFLAIFKTFLTLYALLDLDGNSKVEVNIVTLTLMVFMIVYIHNYAVNYKPFERGFELKMWYLTFLVGFLHTTNDFSDAQVVSFLYLFPFMVVLYLFEGWISARIDLTIATTNLLLSQNPEDIQNQILYLIKTIDNIQRRQNRIALEGYIQYHQRECYYGEDCPCRQRVQLRDHSQEAFKILLFNLTITILKEGLRRFPEFGKKLNLLLGLINHYRIKNPLQAIYAFSKLKLDKPDLLDRIYLVHYLQLVERDMFAMDQKETVNTLEVNKYFDYSNQMVNFQNNIEECTKHHVQFWQLMLDNNPDSRRLEELGTKITRSKDGLKDEFDNINGASSSSIHLLTVYGRFLLEVTNQESYNVKYIEKAQNILENTKESIMQDEGSKYNENSQTGVVIISGNEGQLGVVVHTNNLVKHLIGYSRGELLGQNVGGIMPKVYAENHNAVLNRYILQSQSKVNGKERIVPALTKKSFMLPVRALTKPIANLQKGIQIVGFISTIEQRPSEEQEVTHHSNYILYRSDTEQVLGITQDCYHSYHIHPSLVYGHPHNLNNELKISHLFGVSFQKSEEGRIAAALDMGEVVLRINTTMLSEQFVVGKGSDSQQDILEENEGQVMTGIETEVVVRNVLTSTYYGMPLKLIAFYPKEPKSLPKKDKSLAKTQAMSLMQATNKTAAMTLGITMRGTGSAMQNEDANRFQSDDMKNLKDFKNFISLKTEPTAITVISTMCKIMVLVLTCLIVGLLINWNIIRSLNQRMIHVNKFTLKEEVALPEILTQIDKAIITLSSWNTTSGFDSYATVESLLKLVIRKAKKWQLDLLPEKKKLAGDEQPQKSTHYNYLSTGTISSTTLPLQQSISSYISALQTINLSNLSSIANFTLPPNTTTNNLHQKYHSSKLNMLQSLRSALADTNSVQSKQYEDEIKVRCDVIIGLCITMMAAAILWIVVVLPEVLSVTKINNRVLSLFCLIPYHEICRLIHGCLLFMRNNLAEAILSKDDVRYYEIEMAKKGEDGIGQQPSRMESNPVSPSFNSPSAMGLIVRGDVGNSQSGMIRGSRSGWAEGSANVLDKFQRMSNSQDSNKKGVIIRFVLIVLALLAFMLFYLLFSIEGVSSAKNHSKNYIELGKRVSLIRNCKLLLTEYMIDPTYSPVNLTPVSTLSINIINEFYALEAALLFLELGDYQTSFDLYNNGNLCTMIDSYGSQALFDASLSSTQCSNVNSQVLEKGLKTGIVSLLEDLRSVLTTYSTSVPEHITTEFILRFEAFVKYLETPMLKVLSDVEDESNQLMSMSMLVLIITGCTFLVLLLIVWRLLWLRYLDELNIKIWRTRGLLNLIPMRIISDNELLKKEFTSGQLEKAVR